MARVELLVTVDKIVSSNLQPVSGASALVKLRSTGSPVTVYAAETGGTTVSNPLVTDANGRINGWVDEGSLVLTINGSGITSYNQPYEAVSASELLVINGARIAEGSIPGSAIANNSIPNTKLAPGAVLGKHLAESAMPLGTILLWWQPSRPGGGFVIPSGFALANGQALGPANHDFPGGGTVTLPDLTDKIPIGADPSLGYAVNAATPGANVGMHGTAGANTANLQHQHTHAHTHTIAHSHGTAGHTHSMQSHTHQFYVPDHAHNIPYSLMNNGTGGIVLKLDGGNTYLGGAYLANTGGPSSASTGGASASGTNSQTGGTSGPVDPATPNTSNALSTTQEMRSAVVGVLYIVKVRNTV